jgi:hypothetical protein
MSPFGDGPLDLPYEEQDVTPLTDNFAVSGGAVVMAAVINVAGRPEPALVFRFARADDDGFFPPVLLCVDDGQTHEFGVTVTAAARTAIRQARQARRDMKDTP